jgi:hypothetical protein
MATIKELLVTYSKLTTSLTTKPIVTNVSVKPLMANIASNVKAFADANYNSVPITNAVNAFVVDIDRSAGVVVPDNSVKLSIDIPGTLSMPAVDYNLQELADNAFFSEIVAMAVGKRLSDTPTFNETITKVFGKGLTDTPTFNETLAKVFGKSLSDTPQFNETVVKAFSKQLVETPQFNETIAKIFGKSLTDDARFNETMTKVVGKAVSDTPQFSETYSYSLSKVMSDTVYFYETFQTSGGGNVSTNETPSFSETIAKAFAKVLSDDVRFSEQLNSVRGLARGSTDTPTFNEFRAYNVGKVLADTPQFSETVIKSYSKVIIDTPNINEVVSLNIGKVFAETVNGAETITVDISKILSDTINVSDSYSDDWAGGTDYTNYPGDTPQFIEVVNKSLDKLLYSSQSIENNQQTHYIRRTTNLPSSTSFTISGWTKRISNRSNASYPHVIGILQSATGADLLAISMDSDTSIRINRRQNSSTASTYLSGSPDVGEWFYWAIVGTTGASGFIGHWWDSAGLHSSVTMNELSFTPAYAATLSYPTSASAWMHGCSAHVRVWDVPLTQTELELERLSSVPIRTANLNTAFRDDPAIDISGNNRPWSINGNPLNLDGPPVNDTIKVDESVVKSVDKNIYSNSSLQATVPGGGFSRLSIVSNFPSRENLSFCAWYKLGTSNSGSWLFDFKRDTDDQWYMGIECESGGTLRISSGHAASWPTENLGTRPNTNEWFFLTFTVSGLTSPIINVSWYNKDGVFQDSAQLNLTGYTSSVMDALYAISVGSGYNAGTIVNISQARIWNAVLTQAEFEKEMRSSVPLRTANLYNAIAGSNTDVSGNGNNWNLVGAVTSSIEGPPVNDTIKVNETLNKNITKDIISPTTSIVFEEAADYIRRTTNLPSVTNFTIGFWLYQRYDTSTDKLVMYIATDSTPTPANNILLYFQNTYLRIVAAGTNNILYNNASHFNEWLYIALRFNGAGTNLGDCIIYDETYTQIDYGTFNTESFTPAFFGILSNWDTGRSAGFQQRANLANVRIWSSVLTHAEIFSEMKSPYPLKLDTLYSAFNDDPTTDLSGNNRIWTVNGLSTSTASPPLLTYIRLSESRNANLQSYTEGTYFAESYVGTHYNF